MVAAVGRKIAKEHRARQIPHGKQTVKQLMRHGVSTNSLELSGDTKSFDRVARTMERVYVPTDPHEKAMQRALIQYRNPKNYYLVREALIAAHREDLIGSGPKCLIRAVPPRPTGHTAPPPKKPAAPAKKLPAKPVKGKAPIERPGFKPKPPKAEVKGGRKTTRK